MHGRNYAFPFLSLRHRFLREICSCNAILNKESTLQSRRTGVENANVSCRSVCLLSSNIAQLLKSLRLDQNQSPVDPAIDRVKIDRSFLNCLCHMVAFVGAFFTWTCRSFCFDCRPVCIFLSFKMHISITQLISC